MIDIIIEADSKQTVNIMFTEEIQEDVIMAEKTMIYKGKIVN